MLTEGVVLRDRYRLNERIATGGMGAVWKCTDTLLGREVAVKVLLPSLVADPEFTTRFQAEARMLAALRHPGIVQVHDAGSATLADGSQVSYLVMEYVDGDPLVTWIRQAGRLDPASTMSVVAQAAHALHAAHLAGIVHRDVKPGNLLVKRDGTVVLVDFGIARASTMAGITAAHMVLGTASYMSPEQATGQAVSAATDVYALGAVAYYCLAGRPPFDGDNPLQVALRHAQDEPPPLPVGTPPAVVEVVRRALAKRPADRHPTALALAEAAQDVRDATLASVPVPARPPWAVAGPAVPGPVVLPTPDSPAPPGPPAASGPGAAAPGLAGGTPAGGPARSGPPAGPVSATAPDGAERPTPAPAPGFGPDAPAVAPSAAPGPGRSGPVAGGAFGAAPGPGPVGGAGPAAGITPSAGGPTGPNRHPAAGPPGGGPAGPPPGGPAWAVGAAHPGPRPGGYGPEQGRPAGSGVPPTREEPAGRRGRGRVLALAGAAGVVVVALMTAVAVAALSPDDQQQPDRTALTGETAVADPGQPEPSPSGAAPDSTASPTGLPGQSPSATPSRPAPGNTTPAAGASAAAPSAGSTGSTGNAGGTGAPKPTKTTAAPQKPNPYTAAQACGSGYQVIDSATLTASGVRKGRVYLLYNTASGSNCVVTLKDTDVGRATQVSAYLEVQGKARSTDSGAFSYYAGPVRAAAAKACVKWGGSTGGASYGSGFEHCG
ncbi:protein kinase [Micromonospora sp. NPDC047738]|uniref:serine/threonine-protein kinase n=1 Tax=Micromonospora sp. NPDC047738 TaxID=3155741 RepID=UPI0033C7F59A